MSGEQIQNFVVLGLDINSYSLKTIKDQNKAQREVDKFLQNAIKASGAGKQQPRWVDAGDGGYLLLEWPPTDALEVVAELVRALRESNEDRIEERRIDVRLALHYGQVICWESDFGAKYTSDAINACCRMLTGMSRDRNGQVVCSGEFKKQINVLTDHAEITRLRDIIDKHGVMHDLYNLCRRPGFGIEPSEHETHENPMRR